MNGVSHTEACARSARAASTGSKVFMIRVALLTLAATSSTVTASRSSASTWRRVPGRKVPMPLVSIRTVGRWKERAKAATCRHSWVASSVV